MNRSFKLFDFNFKDQENIDDSDDEAQNPYIDHKNFTIQAFGINEDGKTCSILINDFKPFFYVQVPDSWGTSMKEPFINFVRNEFNSIHI